jgi:hypothetical protein
MKMFSKSLIAAALLATTLTTQFASAAALPPATGVKPVSTYIMPLEGDVDGYSANFGHTFLAADAGKTFTDRYTFTIGSLDLTTGSLTSKPLGSQDLYISSFNVFAADGTLAVKGINNTPASNATGKMDLWALPVSTILGNGNYYLEVTGQVLGKNSSYASEMTLAPVPEPETYAMLLGGLGLIGAVARRRAAKKAA